MDLACAAALGTSGALEYAFTNVSAPLGWQETLAADDTTFEQARANSDLPPTRLHVQRDGTLGAFDSDGSGNRYWATGSLTLLPDQAQTLRWTNQLWTAQP